jgi:hypothetical protein
MVGTDFINQKHIKGNTSEEVIENCVQEIRENSIIKDAHYQKDKEGTLFTFEIENCMHLPIEAKLKEEGVPTYICPPINMILWKIREVVDMAVEIADITADQNSGRCIIRVVVFKQK